MPIAFVTVTLGFNLSPKQLSAIFREVLEKVGHDKRSFRSYPYYHNKDLMNFGHGRVELVPCKLIVWPSPTQKLFDPKDVFGQVVIASSDDESIANRDVRRAIISYVRKFAAEFEAACKNADPDFLKSLEER